MDRDQEQPLVRLERFFREIATGGHPPMQNVEERLVALIGMLGMMPGQFVYVVDFSRATVLHAQGFERVLGIPDAAVDLPMLYNTWHPEDAPTMAHLTRSMAERLLTMDPPLAPFEASMQVDYRMRKADGSYIKVLRNTTVFDVRPSDGGTVAVLSLCQDISHIKHSNAIGWRVAGPGAHRLQVKNIGALPDLQYHPTDREMEVVKALANGLSSARIAEVMGISIHTVNTHRRNLLERSGCRNTAELVRKAIDRSWT